MLLDSLFILFYVNIFVIVYKTFFIHKKKSYWKEYKHYDVRYADGAKISALMGVVVPIFSLLSGLMQSKEIITQKGSILIGIICLV